MLTRDLEAYISSAILLSSHDRVTFSSN